MMIYKQEVKICREKTTWLNGKDVVFLFSKRCVLTTTGVHSICARAYMKRYNNGGSCCPTH